MKTRLLASAAMVLTALHGIDSTASAQADQRIPLRKGEAPAPARTDTVVVRDTVRMTDTLTITRSDTVVQRVEVAPPESPFGRFYWGLDAGAAVPVSALNTSHSTGWTAGALLGWDSYRAPLGLRLDGGYTKFGERSAYACGLPCTGVGGASDETLDVGDPEMLFANMDVKFRLPWLPENGVQVYAVGGATYSRFRGMTFINEELNYPANAVLSTDSWHDKWGGNVGGGLSFGFGSTRLFLESRYQTMNIGNTTQSHVPVVLGITF